MKIRLRASQWGETFEIPDDWGTYLRAVFAHQDWLPECGLNPKYQDDGIEHRMPLLYKEMKAIGQDGPMLEAGFVVAETGTPFEMKWAIKTTSIERAPGALDRLLRIWERRRHEMDGGTQYLILYHILDLSGWMASLIPDDMKPALVKHYDNIADQVLYPTSRDPRGLEALRIEAQTSTDEGVLDLAAKLLPVSSPYRGWS